jgi:hypothetical protein
MPGPKDKTKLTGDTHLPDLDDGVEPDAPAADDDRTAGTPGGEIKDKDAETSNSYGNARDSGERPK